MKKKRRAKRRKIPGVQTALAVATKLGLRQHKGLKDVPHLGMSDEEFYALSEDDQHRVLKEAIRAMPHLDEKVARTMGVPTYLPPGATYDARSGATLHGDPPIACYVGSEAEERDAQLLKGPLPLPKPEKKTGMTCVRCFGWGCAACKWEGHV